MIWGILKELLQHGLSAFCEVPGVRQAQKSGGDLVIGTIRVKAWDYGEFLASECVQKSYSLHNCATIVIWFPNRCSHWSHSKRNECVLMAGNLCRQDSSVAGDSLCFDSQVAISLLRCCEVLALQAPKSERRWLRPNTVEIWHSCDEILMGFMGLWSTWTLQRLQHLAVVVWCIEVAMEALKKAFQLPGEVRAVNDRCPAYSTWLIVSGAGDRGGHHFLKSLTMSLKYHPFHRSLEA